MAKPESTDIHICPTTPCVSINHGKEIFFLFPNVTEKKNKIIAMFFCRTILMLTSTEVNYLHSVT